LAPGQRSVDVVDPSQDLAGDTPRLMRRSDVRAAAKVLAAAFHEDPWMKWTFQDDATRPVLAEAWMRGAAEASLEAGHGYVTRDLSAVALWGPPDVAFINAAFFKPMWSLVMGANAHRMDEIKEGFSAIGAMHPEEGAFYLNSIGVDPSVRGSGRGSKLLSRVLDMCDSDGLPAYLESSSGRNLGLYERHGFKVIQEITIPDGPMMWAMWRDPSWTGVRAS
jgi:ribosomal protein S18 acetylase RimI-like enzyme